MLRLSKRALECARLHRTPRGPERLAELGARRAVPVSYNDLLFNGREENVHRGFVVRQLWMELLTRLSHQVYRLDNLLRLCDDTVRLADGELALANCVPLEQLLRVCSDTFTDLDDAAVHVNEITTLSRADRQPGRAGYDHQYAFLKLIDNMSQRHAANVGTAMDALKGFKDAAALAEGSGGGSSSGGPTFKELNGMVDDFLQVHIGCQMLCTHYLSSMKGKQNKTGRVGIVSPRQRLSDLVKEAISETLIITEHHLTDAPDVIIEGDVGCLTPCIPSHIHHVLFEGLKNALRATVVQHSDVSDCLPPVVVRIVNGGGRYASICISDEGGGIEVDKIDKAFEYLSTSSETFAEVEAKHQEIHSYQPVSDPLSGMGIGLPVSSLYASHFGGSLRMLSQHGWGTQLACYIPTSLDARETIPTTFLSEGQFRLQQDRRGVLQRKEGR